MLKVIYFGLTIVGIAATTKAFTPDVDNINQQMLLVCLGCFALILARLFQAEDMRPAKADKSELSANSNNPGSGK